MNLFQDALHNNGWYSTAFDSSFSISKSTVTVVPWITWNIIWQQRRQHKDLATTWARTFMHYVATMINAQLRSTETRDASPQNQTTDKKNQEPKKLTTRREARGQNEDEPKWTWLLVSQTTDNWKKRSYEVLQHKMNINANSLEKWGQDPHTILEYLHGLQLQIGIISPDHGPHSRYTSLFKRLMHHSIQGYLLAWDPVYH